MRSAAQPNGKTLARNRHKSSSRKKVREPSATAAPLQPQTAGEPPGAGRPPKRAIRIAAGAAASIVIAAGVLFALYGQSTEPPTGADVSAGKRSFVGSETCASCHSAEATLWHGSQHAHAMAHATEATVLGDFNDAGVDHFGVHSRFFRKDGKFVVETDGADGKLAPFEVKYTFGVYPLQQYLVEFPDGRIQALPLAWDARPKEQGGQRWFHLYPTEEISHNDVLHWTKLNQNWNFMCAECHSTGVRKNYDAGKDRFATTWTEISVGCETCHGQGSAHVAWAKAQGDKESDPDKGLVVRFDERAEVSWGHDPKTGFPVRSVAPASLRKEVETCGLCHARRGQIAEDWMPGQPLSDTHLVAALAQGLYQPDGQMLDEVYNYGSFKQSRMFAAGVTCSDCHDPHSAKLKLAGDQVCLQCHAGTYAKPTHTHHGDVNPALTCASCHMPERTFMVIDQRHDHSFRVPRPDLSDTFETSNACNDCHKDKSAAWAAAVIESWFGPERKGLQNYAHAFHAAWHDEPGAATLLAAVAADAKAPSFARAGALADLASHLSSATIGLAQKGLADPDPMVRIGALNMLDGIQPEQLWPIVSPLLSDPIRGVRLRATSLLAAMPADQLSAPDRDVFDAAVKEFIAAQALNADRPEARTTLGGFYEKRRQMGEAEAEFKSALRLSPAFAPAAANLADLYRQLGRNTEAEAVLREALDASPRDAGLHHALGLALVRLKREDEAIAELRRATELEPDGARYVYVYAVALKSTGHQSEAIQMLKDNLTRHPEDRDTLGALIGFNRDAGDVAAALAYAEELAKLEPSNAQLKALIETLRGTPGVPAPSSPPQP
jgi:predicted CXXCH cytochrome family protein